jgi:uncharacterized protein YjbI with pentapeptide repeats
MKGSVGADDPRIREAAERAARGEPLGNLSLAGLVFPREFASPRPLDFTGGDLRGATFAGLDLSGARFSGADISGASFRNVTLTGASFDGCAARGAVFGDVNLAYASFVESDLRGALVFNANMADISLKGATLDGAEVNAIRLSLNGGTHVLGLKEALRALAGESSYPYIAGVSGDAFWISYLLKTRDLNWGGFARDALRRGLENFGFECELVDEVEVDAAWEALRAALSRGKTVITPLHVSPASVLGTGFGGAEWVFVTGIDRGDVRVNCVFGDGMRFSPERFRACWCQHHPQEEMAEDLPVIYAMCVVGPREPAPARVEVAARGLQGAIEVMTLSSTDKVAFGFDAYRHLVEDLQTNHSPRSFPPDEQRRYMPWLGLGVLHHHGSRWAVRDFLAEILDRGDYAEGQRDALAEAHDLYGEACGALQRFLEIMPWGFDLPDETERDEAIKAYERHREEAADLLQKAAARERDALERFRAIVEPR